MLPQVVFLVKYLSIIVAVSEFILGLIVYLRNKRSIVNVSFVLVSWNLGFWSLNTGLLFIFPYTFWINYLIVFFGFSLFVTFNLFLVNFPKPPPKPPKFLYVLFVIWELFILGGLFIPNWFFQSFWVRDGVSGVDFGVGYSLTSLLVLPFFIYFIYLIYDKYRKATGLAKNQMRYMFLGMVILAILGITLALILPLLGIKFIDSFAPLVPIIFVGLTTYAMVKHRLMDIRLVIFRSLLYLILLLFLGSLYILALSYILIPGSLALRIPPNIAFIITSFLLAFSVIPLNNFLVRLTDKWFYRRRYDPLDLQDKIGEITNSILLMDRLLRSLVKVISTEMRLSKFGITLNSGDVSLKGYRREDLDFERLLEISGGRKIIVYDELSEGDGYKEYLRKQNIQVIVPLFIERQVIGFLVLGDKKSGEAYTLEDLNFLILISHQIAIAVRNAQYYQNIINNKKKIERLLRERKKLDKLKEEFIAIATHEIYTPLATTEGYLSLILSGKIGKVDKKARDYLQRAYVASRETYLLLRKMMEASRLEQGELPLMLQWIGVDEIIQEIVARYQTLARKRKITLSYKTDKKLPKIQGDPNFVREILSELIENAFKFTEKGSIIITSQAYKNKIKISVADTGWGIPSRHLPYIFDKFYQVDTSYTREVRGTGLGLYVVNLLLKLHKGGIKVQSTPGEGSKFTFWLPLKINRALK